MALKTTANIGDNQIAPLQLIIRPATVMSCSNMAGPLIESSIATGSGSQRLAAARSGRGRLQMVTRAMA